ncbi:MAG TPA: hypothetical protein VFT62_10485 [Mycobacteriales bacterium]|nr:hypothetical protein [Mycobacteriales bacterium]
MAKLSPRMRIVALAVAGLVGGASVLAAVEFGVASAASSNPVMLGQPGGEYAVNDQLLRPSVLAAGMLHPQLLRRSTIGGRVLHGQATVVIGGGLRVVSIQTGTISALTPSTLTVTSTDGFARQYSVGKLTRITVSGSSGSLSRLQNGDVVHVVALQSSHHWFARQVLEGVRPQAMSSRAHPFPHRHPFLHRHQPAQRAASGAVVG